MRFHHLANYGVIVCVDCGYSLKNAGAPTFDHLRKKHGPTGGEFKAALAELQALALID
jgi:hypothetical protein